MNADNKQNSSARLDVTLTGGDFGGDFDLGRGKHDCAVELTLASDVFAEALSA